MSAKEDWNIKEEDTEVIDEDDPAIIKANEFLQKIKWKEKKRERVHKRLSLY